MARRISGVREALATIVASAFLLTLTACPKDEYDPDTWIEKLNDFESEADFNQAISRLEQLKDPKAIKPLAKAWEKYNRASGVLRAMVHLAEQDKFQGKDGPFWEDAIPTLEKAVSEYDVDQRSIGDAVYAADALGRAGVKSTVPTLIDAATKKMPKLSPKQNVRIAAIRALGNFGDSERAVDTLIRILEADTETQDVRLHAAAANALAVTGHPKALQPLLKALYAIPIIYQQVRKAITRLGPPATAELIRIFQGKHTELNKYAKENNFNVKCGTEGAEKTTCKAPGNLRFKAATLLGDLVAVEAIDMMAATLTNDPNKTSDDPQPAFYDPKTLTPGPTDDAGVLDALRKIGDPKAAQAVFAYAKADSTDDVVRPGAYDVYSMIAPRGKNLKYFEAIVKDKTIEDDQIRTSAGLAYARLSTKKSDLAVIDTLIKYYQKLANDYDKKAKKSKDAQEKAYNETSADQYRATVRTFDQYKTRARVGIECGNKIECYTSFLDLDADQIVKKLAIPGADKMKRSTKNGHRIAALERALIELAKMGPKAKEALPALLKAAEGTERIPRQGILLAMTRIAGGNCPECRDRLEAIIAEQSTQSTLSNLTSDTRVVYHYFLTNSKGAAEKKE